MQEQNYLRGLKLEQLKTTLGAAQQSKVVRGIVEKVFPLQALAIVAVEGGDATLNRISVKVVNLKSGSEQAVNVGETEVGSGFTRYYARMSENVVEGQHVVLQFIQGQHLPTIIKTETVFKDHVQTESFVILDKDTQGFKFLNGGADTAWTKSYGIPGYRFSPFSQYPHGAQANVSTGLKIKDLVTAKTLTSKKIQAALAPSTPSGHAMWADTRGTGHIAMFGDSVHFLAKESNQILIGSNGINAQFLRDPMSELATALEIESKVQPALRFDSRVEFRLPVILNALASEELFAVKAGTPGFAITAETTGVFTESSTKLTARIIQTLKTSSAGINNAGLNYKIAAALAAALQGVGTTVVKRGQANFQTTQNLQSLASFNKTTSNNQALLTYLDGSGQAWATLVCALRMSVLDAYQIPTIRQNLSSNHLKLHRTRGTNNTLEPILLENLFGFCNAHTGLNTLKGNLEYLKTIQITEGYALDPNKYGDTYTYGDLVLANWLEIKSSSDAWIKDVDIFVPNTIGFSSNTGSRFVERLYFDTLSEYSDLDLNTVKSWVTGLYAAQVRTLVQEICMIIEQYAEDLQEFTDTSLTSVLKPTATVSVKDTGGNSKTGKVKAWSSGFITYLMIRLFTGSPGRKAAQDILKFYATNDSQLTREDFANTLGVYTETVPSGLGQAWWGTIESRYRYVANALARSGHFWRV